MGYNITEADGTRIPAEEGGFLSRIEVITDDKTLTVEDSGKVFLMATDAKTFTLPATVKGVRYTFINSGTATNNLVTVSPVAADGIAGTITLAGTVVILDGTVNKNVINTKATSKTGDNLTIIGTGVTGTKAWFKLTSDGIWARQA